MLEPHPRNQQENPNKQLDRLYFLTKMIKSLSSLLTVFLYSTLKRTQSSFSSFLI